MLLPDMPIGFNSDDVPARDEDVGGGPYFGYCNVPKLTSNLPLPDLWGVDALTCGKDCTPFSETNHRKDQAIFLGRPTGKQIRGAICAQTFHKDTPARTAPRPAIAPSMCDMTLLHCNKYMRARRLAQRNQEGCHCSRQKASRVYCQWSHRVSRPRHCL